MKAILDIIESLFVKNGFVMAFLIVGIISLFSNFASHKITRGRIHSSAIAIFLGLIIAYIGGRITGGTKGISDIAIFAGIGVLGGSSLRDFAIISTAFGAKMSEIKKCGLVGVIALLTGIVLTFIVGAIIAVALNLTVGILGELSLGHAGFMCVGAFTSAFFSLCFKGFIQ